VRLRLTALYGTLFLISGAALLAITYVLVRHNTPLVLVRSQTNGHGAHTTVTSSSAQALARLRVPGSLAPQAQQAQAQAAHDRAAELHQLLVQSGIALAFMAVISVALGWAVAGRVLRPLRTISHTTKQISEHNLHQRLGLDGPRDELKDLADTVDGLLERLETAFSAQRRFVANAAHELRTPMTLLRALLEEELTDPGATLVSFRSTGRRLLSIGQDQEQLLEALLTLASSERGLDHTEPLDLAAIADDLLLDSRSDAEQLELRIDANIAPAPASGDPALARRLFANLIDNAVRHNEPRGRIEIETGTSFDGAYLCVTNTGPTVPADDLDRLFEPFQRLGVDRTDHANGHHGLGLSIVRAIATAHDATVTARAQAEGGLVIRVDFPELKSTRHCARGRRTTTARSTSRPARAGDAENARPRNQGLRPRPGSPPRSAIASPPDTPRGRR
jgi:signal transduction histidine kinase